MMALSIQCDREPAEPKSDIRLTPQNADPVFESLIDDGRSLDRRNPTLRWRFNMDHLVTTYRVRAYRQGFDALSAGESDKQNYRLPRFFVDNQPEGTELIWQVTAILESGTQFQSESFVTLLE